MVRVAFDAPLEEIVDASVRVARRMDTYRRQRRHSQWVVTLCFVGPLMFGILRSVDEFSAILAVIALVSSGALGAPLFLLYGRFHDWYTRRYHRRFVREMCRGRDPVRCEFELRPDVLWSKTNDIEVAFPWSQLTDVNDAADSVELWFGPSVAIVRNRAFATGEERNQFLQAARGFMRSVSA